jgi:hypothetical protein
MYEAFLISKTGELRRVGNSYDKRSLEAQGWRLIPEGEYLRLLSFAENKRLRMQNTALIKALRALTENAEYMMHELPYSPPAHLIDTARKVLAESEAK